MRQLKTKQWFHLIFSSLLKTEHASTSFCSSTEFPLHTRIYETRVSPYDALTRKAKHGGKRWRCEEGSLFLNIPAAFPPSSRHVTSCHVTWYLNLYSPRAFPPPGRLVSGATISGSYLLPWPAYKRDPPTLLSIHIRIYCTNAYSFCTVYVCKEYCVRRCHNKNLPRRFPCSQHLFRFSIIFFILPHSFPSNVLSAMFGTRGPRRSKLDFLFPILLGHGVAMDVAQQRARKTWPYTCCWPAYWRSTRGSKMTRPWRF